MQYPEIQFYRGSLVRLASGRLKQVEDLSSDDFLESARLVNQSALSSPSLIDADSPTMELDEEEEEAAGGCEADEEEDDDELVDVVSPMVEEPRASLFKRSSNQQRNGKSQQSYQQQQQQPQDLYIDSSVVRDFLEVSQRQLSQSSGGGSASTSRGSPADNHPHYPQQAPPHSPLPGATVLIKFFLESSRSVVFIEVPIEHPFFVLHRGWSSWNPQRTYDKFGLKCRKLKIGDTCISLIRRQTTTHHNYHPQQPPQHQQHQQQLQQQQQQQQHQQQPQSPQQSQQLPQAFQHQIQHQQQQQQHQQHPFQRHQNPFQQPQHHHHHPQSLLLHPKEIKREPQPQRHQQHQESEQCNLMFSSIKINE